MQSSSENVISHSSLSDTFASADIPRKRAAEAANALAGLKKSIRQLKAIMLSLEWDLSMETLRQLDEEIAAQQAKWEGDKSITGLLRILGALGKYIGRIQAQTHPLAIKLFFAVYNGLEKIVLSPGMSEGKKKKIVLLAYQRYNEVKEKLALREKLIAQQQKKTAVPATPDDQIAEQTERGAEDDLTLGGASESVEAGAAEPAEEGQSFTPALGDADFSSEDEEERKVWLETGESEDLSSKLSSFFADDGGEDGSSAVAEAGEIVSLPQGEVEQQTDEEINVEPVDAGDESAVTGDVEVKKGVIDELFSPTEDSPADQMLTDMHLSVFSSNSSIPTPVTLQDSPPVDSETDDKSQLDAQVTEKLDAFFGESGGEEPVVAEKDQDVASQGDQESAEEVSEEEFEGHLQKKLDSFFDAEDQSEVQSDTGLVPLQSSVKPAAVKPSDILQELLKEIRQQSDGYKHFPDEEERGVLSNLFERAEKACQGMPEVIISLCLLNASLLSFEGSKEPICKEALECAEELSQIVLPLSEQRADVRQDFGKLIAPLKKFLTLIGTDRSPSQGGADVDATAYGYPEYREKRGRSGKTSRLESQYKAKGDLIIEDLFSDE